MPTQERATGTHPTAPLGHVHFKDLGLVCFTDAYTKALKSTNRRMLDGTYGGVRVRNEK